MSVIVIVIITYDHIKNRQTNETGQQEYSKMQETQNPTNSKDISSQNISLLGDLNVEVDNHTYTDHAFQIMPINTGPNNQWAIQRISNPVSEWKDESLSLLTKITIKEMVSQQSRGEYNTKSIILYHNFF